MFEYQVPQHKYSETVRRIGSFASHYARPCRSPQALARTALGFLPIFEWLPHYKWRQDLLGDVLGGLTLSIIHIPQGWSMVCLRFLKF